MTNYSSLSAILFLKGSIPKEDDEGGGEQARSDGILFVHPS